MEKSDDELSINFEGVRKFFNNAKKKFEENRKSKEVSHKYSKRIEHSTDKDSTQEENTKEKDISEESELNISLSKKDIVNFFKKNKLILLLLIPIILSTLIRIQPYGLPATDMWAQQTVDNYYINQIASLINQQYPNLPEQNKQTLINNEFSKLLENRGEQRELEIRQASNSFKEQLKNPNGIPYLLDLDSYYYMRYAENILNNGHSGTYMLQLEESKDQKLMYPWIDFSKPLSWDGERMAPIGSTAPAELHQYVIAFIHKITSIFGNKDIMSSQFWTTPLIMALSVFPAFFIGRRFAGNVGGLFASVLLVVHQGVLSRTITTDTDMYTVLFPLLMVWFTIEAFYAKEKRKALIYSGLAGLSTALFAFAWNAWWFTFVLVAAGISLYIIYNLISYFLKKEKEKLSGIINNILTLLAFVFSSWLFVRILGKGFNILVLISLPFTYTNILDVGYSLWPNIQTTVAELNVQSTSSIIYNLIIIGPNGLAIPGEIVLFFALAGLLLSLKPNLDSKSDKALFKIYVLLSLLWFGIILSQNWIIENIFLLLFLIAIPYLAIVVYGLLNGWRINVTNILFVSIFFIWIAGSLYTGTKGIRFMILFLPSVLIPASIGFVLFSRWVGDILTKFADIESKKIQIPLLVIFGIIVLLPLNVSIAQAKVMTPYMNDQWYDTLKKIDNEALPDAIINSWWDFGHWFITLANRRVTFDGAGQDRHMAYWIGRSLYTNDEKHAAGILRMVDCGNNNAFWKLDSYINNTVISIDILNEIIVMNREKAKEYLTNYITPEQAEEVLQYSHCDPPEDYYITSEDMIGKAGVWSHFGAWDFRKANLVFLATQNKKDEAVSFMMNEYGYDKNKAEQEYARIKALGTGSEANTWISGWAGYYSTPAECQGIVDNKKVSCNNILIDIENGEAELPTEVGIKHPASFSYIDKNGNFIIKEYTEDVIEYSTNPFGIAFIEKEGRYYIALMHPDLVGSIFTRLHFFEGKSSKCFEQFDHKLQFNGAGNIYTWKVNWECLNG